MCDYDVGDKVVCVRSGRCDCFPALTEMFYRDDPELDPVVGRAYTVSCLTNSFVTGHIFVRVAEIKCPSDWWYCSCNFRKIRRAEDNFVARMRALKPPQRVPEDA